MNSTQEQIKDQLENTIHDYLANKTTIEKVEENILKYEIAKEYQLFVRTQ